MLIKRVYTVYKLLLLSLHIMYKTSRPIGVQRRLAQPIYIYGTIVCNISIYRFKES